ncbi:MAG: polymorphic toxin-type HINT domain-containing protein [Isosphaeraceae bacterium]|nr:polymorphic toxin-type HINT domain-containing protein [Isosphaeraceae bacterium]
MLAAFLLCAGLVSESPTAKAVAAEDRAAYESARASVGRSPDAHVKLALWCEAHGLQAERLKHLAIAVLADPKQATARGLLGLVAYGGQWQRPDAVTAKISADPALTAVLADYNARRARTPNTADAHEKLALWCEEAGLRAEAKAHWSRVVRLDPARELAWKHLGYKKVAGRWTTAAQLAAERAEAEEQKQANRHWEPLLTKWRGWLADKRKRGEAEQRLSEVTDPRAVPAVMATFASGDGSGQAVAVRVVGQIDAPGASRALATLAVFSESAEVRRIATETLKKRDCREYAGLLVALMHPKVKYEVRPVGGPGLPGELFIAGERVNVRRRYSPPPSPIVNGGVGNDLLTVDANGLPVLVRGTRVSGYVGPDGFALFGPAAARFVARTEPSFNPQMLANPGQAAALLAAHPGSPSAAVNPWVFSAQAIEQGFRSSLNPAGSTILIGQAILETQRAAASAQQQLEADVAALDRYNADTDAQNGRVGQILNDVTGQDLPAEPQPWQAWFIDQIGFAQLASDSTKPTIVQDISPQLPPLAGFDDNENGYIRRISCFGAGTLVRTQSGPRPIETLEVGDQVLTQDTRTGALGYQPILVVHRNPPSRTFEIALGGETIVSSHFHRFWKAGRGWVMARDLQTGDRIRTLGGLAKVESIRNGRTQPVFNLDVADSHDFFAGAPGALVHDNTLPDPRLAPFDASPSLAATPQPHD